MSKEIDAYKKLEQAAGVFQNAIMQFKKVVDTDTVGLREWIEGIDETLYEIEAEITGDDD